MTKNEAFARLARSKFRSRFKLAEDDLAYIESVGLETVRRHLPPEAINAYFHIALGFWGSV